MMATEDSKTQEKLAEKWIEVEKLNELIRLAEQEILTLGIAVNHVWITLPANGIFPEMELGTEKWGTGEKRGVKMCIMKGDGFVPLQDEGSVLEKTQAALAYPKLVEAILEHSKKTEELLKQGIATLEATLKKEPEQ